jgi:predicted DsbA family dithiol-disulfide isomerase
MGGFDEFNRECYRALWDHGLDRALLSVLQQLGENVVLDSQEIKSVLDTGQYALQTKKQ